MPCSGAIEEVEARPIGITRLGSFPWHALGQSRGGGVAHWHHALEIVSLSCAEGNREVEALLPIGMTRLGTCPWHALGQWRHGWGDAAYGHSLLGVVSLAMLGMVSVLGSWSMPPSDPPSERGGLRVAV